MNIQRRFLPGSEWLYFKIYAGHKVCEELLIKRIYTAIKQLINSGMVSKWFFIRYSDPDYHIRLRLLLADNSQVGVIILRLYEIFGEYEYNHKIKRIEIDTYDRELERYGFEAIDRTETLFWNSSEMTCEILKVCLKRKNDDLRWMAAFIIIDRLLSHVGLFTYSKLELLSGMSDAYLHEFGYNIHNRKSLNDKYRQIRSVIETVMTDTADVAGIKEIQTFAEDISLRDFSNLNITACIHMAMNRLFLTQNRMCELVIYYCLVKYYKSLSARMR